MSWEDSHNTILEQELSLDESHVWKFRLEENKKSGIVTLNARLFSNRPNYSGPTKNGFIHKVTAVEDINILQDAFNKFFDEAKKKL